MMLIDCLFYILLAINALCATIFLYLMFRKHKDREKCDKAYLKHFPETPKALVNAYEKLLCRRKNANTSYCIYQVIHKLSGFLSVSLSILSLSATLAPAHCSFEISIVIAVFSILCVIVALYLSTEARIKEHSREWREYDNEVNVMQAEMPSYSSYTPEQAEQRVRDIMDRIYQIEKSVTSNDT